MRVAVLGGAGAMGGLFGAYLARGGTEVHLVDVSAVGIEAIRRDGLTIEENDGSASAFRLPITNQPAEIGPVDLILTFVKCYHTEPAIRSILPIIHDSTVVLTVQNGWGNAERIAALVGAEKVLVGLTYHSATLREPGRVAHTAKGATLLGEIAGEPSDRLDAVAGAFRLGGMEVSVSDRIVDEVWRKLSLNACALPPSALLRCEAQQLVGQKATRDLVAMILREVVDVAHARGIPMDYEERHAAICGHLAKAVGVKTSMLQDVEAGRTTEIEVINGAISRAGREVGLSTPVNDTMVALVSALKIKSTVRAGG